MAKKIFNADVEVLGALNMSTVPNSIGDVLTFDALNQVSRRTYSQILGDVGAVAKAGDTMTGFLKSTDSTNIGTASEESMFNKFGILGNRGTMYLTNGGGNIQFGTGATHNADPKMTILSNGELRAGGVSDSLIWHAGNDGAGSGLDADLLDGFHRPDNFGEVTASYDTIDLNTIETVSQSAFYRSTSTNKPDSGDGYMFQMAQGDIAGSRGAQLADGTQVVIPLEDGI
jgi:hypothetical protein